jgi:pimeloyl-ACP methyl ester carboxylesterase
MFTIFGLNGFLQFIHQSPPTNPLALQFFIAITTSHFSAFFFAVQLDGGLLLLSGYFVPLALVLTAAEIFNMDAYADDLSRLLDPLDLKDAVLVGHLAGGGEVARSLSPP